MTFGFECEFEEGAPDLVAELHRTAPHLIGMNNLHSYHCGCPSCSFYPEADADDDDDDDGISLSAINEWLSDDDSPDPSPSTVDAWVSNLSAAPWRLSATTRPMQRPVQRPYPLRAQRDSSCSGELISKPFESLAEARETMQAIERAAVETDAIPGFRSGFHVHVGLNLTPEEQYEALFQFLRWEPFLCRLARGRFDSIREANRTARDSLSSTIHERLPHRNWEVYVESVPRILEVVRQQNSVQRTNNLATMFLRHRQADRHSNLCITTRHNTWEFRLWNSTRSAWRMEMYAGISIAMMDPAVVMALNEYDTLTPRGGIARAAMDNLVSVIRSVYPETADLIQRQLDYNRAMQHTSVPSTFTQ